jgi:hypothetical protein
MLQPPNIRRVLHVSSCHERQSTRYSIRNIIMPLCSHQNRLLTRTSLRCKCATKAQGSRPRKETRQQYLPFPECWGLDLSARRYFQEAKGAIRRSSPPDRLSQHDIGQKASKHHRCLSYQYISSGSRSRALNHTLLSNYCQCGCNGASPCMEMPADHQILLRTTKLLGS